MEGLSRLRDGSPSTAAHKNRNVFVVKETAKYLAQGAALVSSYYRVTYGDVGSQTKIAAVSVFIIIYCFIITVCLFFTLGVSVARTRKHF